MVGSSRVLDAGFAGDEGIASSWEHFGQTRKIQFQELTPSLFGIAVLNGQILIEAIRSKLRESSDTVRAVKQATTERLRPVLATAITDAIGFLPMAISTGVGSEVQKPLATVVIGGVITSTALTLVVLPILYIMTQRRAKVKNGYHS